MVFCYQLSSLNQVAAARAENAEAGQLSALRSRVGRLLENVEAKMTKNWPTGCISVSDFCSSAMLQCCTLCCMTSKKN